MNIPNSITCQIANLNELYNKYFPEKTDGIFVDVGAYDGYNWSNVWGLAEIGWHGICLEPIRTFAKQCEERYVGKPITVFNLCAGDFVGETVLYMDPGGVSNTIDEETAKRNPFGFSYDPIPVPITVVTLTSLFDQIQLPEDFELISIDVEGAELKVLNGWDIDKYRPKMVIIETHKGQSGKDYNAPEIYRILESHGYSEIQCDTLNSIFIRQ